MYHDIRNMIPEHQINVIIYLSSLLHLYMLLSYNKKIPIKFNGIYV